MIAPHRGRPPVAHGVGSPLVALIRSQPGMAERLLAEHADDGSGRCRVCSSGAMTGHYRWPCTIGLCATEAGAHDGDDGDDATVVDDDR